MKYLFTNYLKLFTYKINVFLPKCIEIIYKMVPKTLHKGQYITELIIIFSFYRNYHLKMTSLRVIISALVTFGANVIIYLKQIFIIKMYFVYLIRIVLSF